MESIKIENLLNWSEPRRVYTKYGYKLLYKSTPDNKFWDIWRANKELLKEAGISVTKNEEDGWEVLWWRIDKESEKTRLESKQVLSNIDLPKPNNIDYYPFQKAAIKFAMQRNSVLFGDSMGIGKTIEAIGTINATKNPGKILIICPNRIKINWRNELKKWLIHDLSISIINSKNWIDDDIVIINYDILKNHVEKLHSIEWDFIIIDEVHYLKNPKAKRTKIVFGDNKELKPIQAKHKLLLTGTPILNRPVEGFPLFNYLNPIQFRNFFTYAKKYCDAHDDGWGWDFSGASNLKELQDKIRSLFMIRRLKADVLPELPPKQRQVIVIPANGNSALIEKGNLISQKYETKREELKLKAEVAKVTENKKEYDRIIRELKAVTNVMFTETASTRHETALAKVPDVYAHLENMFEQDIKKIVVFAHHRDVIEKIHDHFKDCSVILYGGMTNEQSEDSIQEFQHNDKIKLFIGNIQAAGVGITLTAASIAIFVEIDWVPGNMIQAEDRCILKGQNVITKNGFKKIEDIEIGDFVYTHLGNYRKVLQVKSRSERKKYFVDIKYKGFFEELKLTNDHNLYVFDKEKNKFLWVRADELNVTNHFLVLPKIKTEKYKNINYIYPKNKVKKYFFNQYKKKQTNGRLYNLPCKIKLTDDLLFAFGWYIAEGWSVIGNSKCSSKVGLCGNAKTKKTVVKKVAKIISDAFEIDKYNLYDSKNNCISATFYSKNLAYYFRDLFGKSAHKKQFPDWVFGLSNHKIEKILEGYFEGDGYRRKNTQQASTVSSKLAIQLVMLNAILGFSSTLRYGKSSKCWSYEHAIKGIKTLIKNSDGSILFPISEIRSYKPKRGKEMVYDLTVEKDHSFIVGLSSVHNCHRIGQHNPVLIQHLVLENSFDSRMIQTIVEKQYIIDEILDDKIKMSMSEELPTTIDITIRQSVLGKHVNKSNWTEDVKQQLIKGLQILSSRCDGARSLDHMGFNRLDTCIGKSLAQCISLSNKQATIAHRLLIKYRKQLPEELNVYIANLKKIIS